MAGGSRKIRLWDPLLRGFHWLLVFFVILSWCLGQFGPAKMTLHFWSGYVIAGLLIFRLIWGFVGPAPARFAHFLRGPGAIRDYAGHMLMRRPSHWPGHNPLGALSVIAMLAALVASGQRHEAVTRQITDIADAVTRRLLVLAEAALGPAPGPWLWAACGSQGRQEQTGISDQDNCLILGPGMDPGHPWFADLARFVCDGLNAAGYVYCPGDMMATNPRWRQPVEVWRGYFRGWIDRPSPEAQMLASVMFDLRAIAGEAALLGGLQAGTLAAATPLLFAGLGELVAEVTEAFAGMDADDTDRNLQWELGNALAVVEQLIGEAALATSPLVRVSGTVESGASAIPAEAVQDSVCSASCIG